MAAATRDGQPNLGFDPEALREKYRQERDKRIRPEGESQYPEVSGRFAHFIDDPYVAPGFTRAPLTDEVEVVIIGAGFSGLLAAARLREAGVAGIRIVDAGGDFGGTWYWNRYPGAQCDIESYCYLPLLEELGYMPKEKYSFAPEIFEHSQNIAKAFQLYDVACFQTRVTELNWDERLSRWIVSTDRNDAMKARFVVLATGPASRPKLPGIPGIDEFEGHTFHTSRWDYAYTGGDHSGNLNKLSDKRVAVIGTGATAIQCVPHVGAHAKHLYAFQRTPSSVDERGNKPTDPEWARSLAPGWQRARRENFNDVVTGHPFEVDLVSDAWTDIFRNLQSMTPLGGEAGPAADEAERLAELADFQKIGTAPKRRVGIEINGVGGQSLWDYWSRGLRTLHGFTSHGFPNWFFIGIGQNGLSVNMTSMFDDQARHVAYIIKEVTARGRQRVQPTAEAEATWVATIRGLSQTNRAFSEACTPGYYNSEGKLDAPGSLNAEAYAPGANAFNALLAEWRNDGQLEGLELS
jgi:cyclohexanone monooxygenase